MDSASSGGEVSLGVDASSSMRSASAQESGDGHAANAPAAASAALTGALCGSDNGTSGRRRQF